VFASVREATMPASGGGATRTIGARHDFNAPAEVVFGVLTDPDRTTRWLPVGMQAESRGTDAVRVRAGAHTHEYDVEVVPDRLEVRWHSVDMADLRGSVQVRDAPAGGSVVDAEVAVPDGAADPARAQELLAEAMRHLQRDVDDNFNAG
jgi:uncharacterized protein YndB with AHSA1/START domain